MVHIDFLTVLVAAIVYLIIRGVWYSKQLFGNYWLNLKGISENNLRKKPLAFLGNFLVALILSYFLSFVEVYLGATSFWDGVVAGFIIWFGFIFPVQFTEVIWIKKSGKLFWLESSCILLSLMVMGGILVG